MAAHKFFSPQQINISEEDATVPVSELIERHKQDDMRQFREELDLEASKMSNRASRAAGQCQRVVN